MDKKKILLIKSDKEQNELFASWFKEENYEVKTVSTPDEAADGISKAALDLLIMDIDTPKIIDKYLHLCQTLKKDARTSYFPIAVLIYKKDVKKIAGAIEAGVDSFMFKPFETDSFLARVETIFKQIELKKQRKKVLDLNFINYLIALAGETEHEDFFVLAPVIFNKLIIEKINTILGNSIITQIIKRVNELVGEDYVFMREVKFFNARIFMDAVEKVSKDIPAVKLAAAFRDYVYAFLQLVRILTSDILIERGD